MAATTELADFAAQLGIDEVPDAVRMKLRLHTLDQIGAQIAGSTRSWNTVVRQYALDQTRPGVATVVGAAPGAAPEWAAFSNATAGHGFESDDYHPAALSHPGCVAVPTVLAMGEQLDCRGDVAVLALALGFEAIVRVGLAVQPSMIYDRGFHETGAAGVFGAALAGGRMRGLDADSLASALGIAGSHASGTTEYSQSGGDVKRLHAGLGAMGGLRAVDLAARGFVGPPTILEGPRGFLQAFAQEPRVERLTCGLGDRWELLDTAIKPYFNCGLIHAPIDSLRRIIDSEKIGPDEIDEIVVGCDHLSLVHVGEIGPSPKDMTGAQFSMEYSLAMAVILGDAGFRQYVEVETRRYNIPEIEELARRIRLQLDSEVDAAFPDRFMSRVQLRTRDGRLFENLTAATGSPDAPMTDAQIRAKFEETAGVVVGEAAARTIARRVDALFDGGPVSSLLEPCRKD